MNKLKNIIKMLAKEVIDEMSGTGAVAGYATPFAFSKGGKNQATKAIEKLGFKTVDEKLDPIGKEDADVNNDGKVDKQDKYLLNRRKKISAAKNKNKKLNEESLDISTSVIDPINKKARQLDKEEKNKLEIELKKYESMIQQKVSGKIVTFKGRKGDPYQAVKDYSIRLSPISANPVDIENWPSKNNPLNFQIKIIGKQVSKDGKEFGEESNFFIDFSIPNSFIIGTSTSEPSQSPTVSQPVAAPQQSNVQSTQTVPVSPVKPDEKTLDGQIAR